MGVAWLWPNAPPVSPVSRPVELVELFDPRAALAFTVAPPVQDDPVGALSRPSSSLTVGLTSPAPFRIGTTLQLKYGSVLPSAPCASAELTELLKSWLAQAR